MVLAAAIAGLYRADALAPNIYEGIYCIHPQTPVLA